MKLKGLGRGLDALLAGNETLSKEQQRSLPVGAAHNQQERDMGDIDPDI